MGDEEGGSGLVVSLCCFRYWTICHELIPIVFSSPLPIFYYLFLCDSSEFFTYPKPGLLLVMCVANLLAHGLLSRSAHVCDVCVYTHISSFDVRFLSLNLYVVHFLYFD